MISALLSRCQIYELRPLGAAQIEELVRRALSDERGILDPPEVAEDAIEVLVARSAATRGSRGAERAVEAAGERRAGRRVGGGGRAAAQGAPLRPRGRPPHDYISAWIKSTRGSDPDASLYYLAVMLEGGEDLASSPAAW